jgi:twitching motility protein PilT
MINQREVGTDTKSFAAALRAALREDPDVILVGEMRDLETTSIALTAAETGHLVFATLHTNDTVQTVDRIIDQYPPHQQQQVRVQLAAVLQGIVSQILLPRADGQGRIVAVEVLVANPAVRNLIREGKTHQIYSVLQTGAKQGMVSLDMYLVDLAKRGIITYDDALSHATNPDEMRRLGQFAQPIMRL